MEDKFFGGSTISDSSKKIYMSKLRSISGEKDLKNLNFLKDTDAVIKRIEELSENPNTQRTAYIAISSVLKDKKPFKKMHDIYHAKMMQLNGKLNKESHKSENTKKKVESVSMDELLQRQKDLMTVLPEIKKKIDLNQFIRLHDLVITSIYTLLPPRRNLDYACMVVGEPTKNPEINYYHNGKFVFNNYKTAGSYKQVEIDVPKELQDILAVWLKYKPTENNHLLLHPDVHPPMHYSANDMTKVLKRAFNNKDMGVSVLRNVFLTTKYGNMTEQLKDDTAKMGTSVAVANSTYIN
jgi:hypothetical protein